MTTIYLVRHGENLDNLEGILNGHRDRPLSPKGEEQAHMLGQKIKQLGLMVDVHYCSPLTRAKHTAEMASKVGGLPFPVTHDDLIERDFGDLTGTLTIDIEKNYDKGDIVKTELVTYFPNPHNGESFDQNIERAKRILHFMNQNHPDQSIMLTGHGDCCKAIYCAFYNLSRQEGIVNFNMYNTDIVILKDGWDVKNVKL